MQTTLKNGHQPPAHYGAEQQAEYHNARQAELDAIAAHGRPARRDLFNAEYPAPYRGTVTPSAHARFDAICTDA